MFYGLSREFGSLWAMNFTIFLIGIITSYLNGGWHFAILMAAIGIAIVIVSHLVGSWKSFAIAMMPTIIVGGGLTAVLAIHDRPGQGVDGDTLFHTRGDVARHELMRYRSTPSLDQKRQLAWNVLDLAKADNKPLVQFLADVAEVEINPFDQFDRDKGIGALCRILDLPNIWRGTDNQLVRVNLQKVYCDGDTGIIVN